MYPSPRRCHYGTVSLASCLISWMITGTIISARCYSALSKPRERGHNPRKKRKKYVWSLNYLPFPDESRKSWNNAKGSSVSKVSSVHLLEQRQPQTVLYMTMFWGWHPIELPGWVYALSGTASLTNFQAVFIEEVLSRLRKSHWKLYLKYLIIWGCFLGDFPISEILKP